jgi:hypothetical protein
MIPLPPEIESLPRDELRNLLDAVLESCGTKFRMEQYQERFQKEPIISIPGSNSGTFSNCRLRRIAECAARLGTTKTALNRARGRLMGILISDIPVTDFSKGLRGTYAEVVEIKRQRRAIQNRLRTTNLRERVLKMADEDWFSV